MPPSPASCRRQGVTKEPAALCVERTNFQISSQRTGNLAQSITFIGSTATLRIWHSNSSCFRRLTKSINKLCTLLKAAITCYHEACFVTRWAYSLSKAPPPEQISRTFSVQPRSRFKTFVMVYTVIFDPGTQLWHHTPRNKFQWFKPCTSEPYVTWIVLTVLQPRQNATK